MDAETPRARMKLRVSVSGRGFSLKAITPSSVMHTMGLRDPYCKPERRPLTFRDAMKWRETSHFPPQEVGGSPRIEEALLMSSRIDF